MTDLAPWLLLGGAALALFGGLGFGAYRAAQSPAFYAAVVAALWDRIGPEIMKSIAKDFSPDWAEKVRDAARRGELDGLGRGGKRHPGESR